MCALSVGCVVAASACSERSASLVSAGTASLGGQTTATMGAGSGSIRDTASGHDYPSLTISDDMSFEFGQELEGVIPYGKRTLLLFFVLS